MGLISLVEQVDFQLNLIAFFNGQVRILDRQQSPQFFAGIPILFGCSNLLGLFFQFSRPGFQVLQLNPLDFVKDGLGFGKRLGGRDVVLENPSAGFHILGDFAAFPAGQIDLGRCKLVFGAFQ